MSNWREEVQQFLDNECGMNDGNYVIYEWKTEELLSKIDKYQKVAERLYKELKWASECVYEEASDGDRVRKILKDCENQLNQIP